MINDQEREILERKLDVEWFLKSKHGETLRKLMNETISELLQQIGRTDGSRSSEYYAGGIGAITQLYNKMYGTVMYGKAVEKAIQSQSEKSTTNERTNDLTPTHRKHAKRGSYS